MNREELEGRSKSELIDLLVQQQTHLAQLQARAAELQAQLAQLQLSKRNGEAETAALPDIPAGRFPLTLKLIAMAGLALVCGIVVIVANFRPGARIAAGKAQDYAPGSITILRLPAPDRGAQAIPILLVNDLDTGFLALHARDPGSNCLLAWNETAQRIEDRCSASAYTRTGGYLSGPSPRGLDRYAVSLDEGGDIIVDVGSLQAGPARP